MKITAGKHGADPRKGVSINFFAGVCKLLARCHGNRLLDVAAVTAIKDRLSDIEILYKKMDFFPKFKRKPGYKGKDTFYCTCWNRDAGREPACGDCMGKPNIRRGSSSGPIHVRGDEKCWKGKKA